MTAGHQDSLRINQNLATAAAENGWLMAVGSQRRELTDPQASGEWRKIKLQIPQLQLVANIGILELMQYPVEIISKLATDMGALGLYVHVNGLQEIFQGNLHVNFAGAIESITKLAKHCRTVHCASLCYRNGRLQYDAADGLPGGPAPRFRLRQRLRDSRHRFLHRIRRRTAACWRNRESDWI